jgi:phosphoribosyl-AMP cyclohydrolase
MFKKRENVTDIEEGSFLSPRFDKDGLIPVITICSSTKEVLMHGYMNNEALKKTIETKESHYWSRSRKELWHKGQTSGFVQKVLELKINDTKNIKMEFKEKVKKFDPKKIYKGQSNPTKI